MFLLHQIPTLHHFSGPDSHMASSEIVGREEKSKAYDDIENKSSAADATILDMKADEEKTLQHASNPYDPSQFPDGGSKAWLCALGGFCCLFSSFGWISCIGVFQDYYQDHQLSNYSSSTVAWIPSLEIFMMFLGGPIVGKAFDSYGPRWLLVAGTFLHVFGLMMTSLSTEYYQFILAQGTCSPIGASMVFYPGRVSNDLLRYIWTNTCTAMNSAASWFLKKRALVLGILASGSSLGGVIMPIMVQHLIREIGFGWAMRCAAFLILFMMIIANLTVTSRFPHSPKPLVLMEFVRPLRELPFLLVTTGA